jgi:hypothetical protein
MVTNQLFTEKFNDTGSVVIPHLELETAELFVILTIQNLKIGNHLDWEHPESVYAEFTRVL